MGIDAHQLAIVIGVAITRTRRPRLDVAHHRASIAADLVVDGSGRGISQHEQALKASVRLPDKPTGSDVSSTRVQAAFITRRPAFCSYTNDVAREPKNCQACLEAKKPAAE
jgi:hypothetical protein